MDISYLLESSCNSPRTATTQPQKSPAVDNLLAVVFVGKSHRELIKMLRLLERSEKLKENKNVVQDCGCMQDNLLVTKTDIPIKLPA